MTTRFLSTEESRATRKWHIIDAADKPVGRLATVVANLLRGKHKPGYTPHSMCGDCVVVINAAKVKLTGNKLTDKMYRRHSHWMGGLKTTPAGKLLATKPEQVVEFAVFGMISYGKQSRRIKTMLKVYAGAEHPHSAQKPEKYELLGKGKK